MKWLDAALGRNKETKPNLDSLFALPDAAVTLEAALSVRPTGRGAVCFRAADGAAYQQTQDDVIALIKEDDDKPDVHVQRDDFGFTFCVFGKRPLAFPCLHRRALHGLVRAFPLSARTREREQD